MAETWYLEEEIPTLRRETPDVKRIKAADVEQVWTAYALRQPHLARRFRHCRGCVYLRGCGAELVCNFILSEGKKRPCPYGAHCKVKKTPRGYRVPQEHLEWVKKVDVEEQQTEPEHVRRHKKGRDPIWDVEYAKMLYDKGYAISEIVQIVSVKKNTIANYAELHGWYKDRRKTFPHADAATLEAERQKYEEWKQSKQRAQEDAESG